ncbi:MAG: AraC family transcriptional regulator [Salinibacterium amurskyense]
MDRYALTGVLGADSGRIGAETVDVPETIEPHAHDFVEIALVVSGHGTHISRTGTDDAVAGSVFLVRPGSWHSFEPISTMTVVNVYFDERVLFEHLPWLFTDVTSSRRLLSAGTSSWTAPADVFGDAVAWATSLEQRPQAPFMISVGLLTCIMAVLTDFGDPDRVEQVATSSSDLVWSVVAQIVADPAHDWSVPAVAAAANLSPSHFTRIFRRELGTSPARFIAQVRLERAALLLVSTDLAVARVGEQAGIDDANYFARIFRNAYGISPKEYRAGIQLLD